ncbi:MAG: T9SS type A sorting domain-containing protein [Flavobacteriales bacterium]|nr:T9SS type A sorting domain-containing protein [Flavobacteriales bacterium]
MMSKTINLVVALFCGLTTVFSQQQVAVNSAPAPEGYALEVTVVNEDIGILVGALGVTDLTGFSSTRLYVTMNNADDFMSSVSGDITNPTLIETTTSFYHAVLGAATPNGINSLLFPVYPDLPYDSWVTIGLEGVPNAAAGEAAIATVQSTDNPWSTNFDPGGGLPGGNIAIDDAIGGAWYALNGDSNGIAGDDLKVLVGQFTTDGELSGQLYCQVFINGDGSTEFRDTFYFGAGGPVLGCTDAAACNYNELATEDDGSCEFPLDLYGSANVDCDGICLNDADEDGICDEDEIPGCTDQEACNYEPTATDDDTSCTFPAADNLDCAGNCLNDSDQDGICDEDEIAGCTNEEACNYEPTATDDDASCTFPAADNLDCAGNCLNDADDDGICDEDEVLGCTDSGACNYSPLATDDDGSCEFTSCAGCTDATACNYDAAAIIDDGSCTFLDGICQTCENGVVIDNDADGDDICDEDETAGCTDPNACNAGVFTDTDNSTCTYPAGFPDNIVDCDGSCLNDADEDGVCDEEEVPGCTDDAACNYDAPATDDDGSCQYPVDIYGVDYVDCDGGCLNDEDGDGVCDEEELAGCTDPEACNTGDFTDSDNSLCVYAVDENGGITNLDCDGNCYNDTDGDGVCDEDEVIGCQDDTACNYDAAATDAGTCDYADEGYDCAGNCLEDTDGDGTCDPFEIVGCQEEAACNYNPAATDAGTCEYPEDLYGVGYVDCDGGCLNDLDDDGICNEDEALAVTGGGVEVALADGAPIDSSVALLNMALENPSDDLIAGLIASGNGDLVVPAVAGSDCGSIFLPVDDAWGEAGYNLNVLSVDVLSDLIVGHVFPGLCETLSEGDVYNNYYGEAFSYTEEGGQARLLNAEGEAFLIENGGYRFNGNSYLYAISKVIPLESADPCLGCANLVIDGDLADYTVECESELVAATAAEATGFACNDLELDNVVTVKNRTDGRNQICSGGGTSQIWNAVTAGDDPNFNNGPDALLQFYDMNGDMGGSHYFIEDIANGGVSFQQFENGTALMQGMVMDTEDNSLRLEIHLFFEGRTVGADWAGGFKNDYGCATNTDLWTVYTLNNEASYAVGGPGAWDFGTLIHFSHQPASEYFGFQLGNGANNHNCEDNGFSGWFSWSGSIAGEDAMGFAGDVIATLEPSCDMPTNCIEGEYVEFHYIAFDDQCNVATEIVQTVTRDDVTAPVYVSGAPDTTITCDDSEQWLADNLAEDEIVLFTDNCDDSEYGCAAGFDPNTSGFADGNTVYVCVELVGETTAEYTASSCRVLNRTWVATDCFGNQTYHVQAITIEDTTAPDVTVTAPSDVTLNVNGLCFVDLDPTNTGVAEATYADNCDLADTGLDYSDVVVDSVSTGCYSIIRTWTAIATDSCGNATAETDNQRIDIQDAIAPSFLADGIDTLECDLWMDCSYEYLNSVGLITVVDNCELSHVETECTPLSAGCWDDFIVDYTAYDMCGNMSTFQQIVVVTDRTSAEWTLASADYTLECSDESLTGFVQHELGTFYAVPEFTPGDGMHAEALDNCDSEAVVSYSDLILTTPCNQEYTIKRTYSTTDCSGNYTEHIQYITVEDTTAPEFTAFPADVTVECDAVPAVADLGTLAALDNCDNGPEIAYMGEVRTDGACEDTYTLTRTWETSDCAGNIHSQSQTIEVQDTQAPMLSIQCPDDILYTNVPFADGDLSIATNGEPTWVVSDNCDGDVAVAYTYEDVAVALDTDSDDENEGDYELQRTFTVTATDNCGNETVLTCMQVLTFTDEEAPMFDGNPDELYPAPITCGDMPDPYDVSVLPLHATDNGDGQLTYEISMAFLTSGSCPGTYVRIWYVTDDSGNESESAIQYVATVDTLAPEFDFCPEDIEVFLDENCTTDVSTDVTGMATVTDNCDANPEVTFEDIMFVDLPGAAATDGADYIYGDEDAAHNGSYQFTRVFSSQDACENENWKSNSYCEHVITVTDALAPSLSVTWPADRVETLNAECEADLSLDLVTAEATDNCDGDVTIAVFHMDSAPIYTCTGDGLAEGSYTFTRSWTAVATDDSGNETTLTHDQSFTVNDEISPMVTISGPADYNTDLAADCTVDTAPGAAGEATASATDNCDSDVSITIEFADSALEYTCSDADGSAEGSYTFERTWTATATDDCGNASSDQYVQTIMVNDITAPLLSAEAPADQLVQLDADCSTDLTTGTLGYATHTTSDACDSDVTVETSFSDSAPEYTCGGDDDAVNGSYVFTRTFSFTATDDCGNSTSVTVDQLITVEDNVNPSQTIETLAPVTLYLDGDCETDRSDVATGIPTVTTSDNCDSDVANVLTYMDSPNVQTCSDGDAADEGSYTFTRTWTSVATDDCGNENTITTTQDITVLDEMAPQFTLTCGISNDEIVEYACGDDNQNGLSDIFDFTEIPAPCDVSYADNCDSEVTLSFSSVESGYLPTADVAKFCMPLDVEAGENGETCDDRDPEVVRLFNFPGAESFTIVEGGSSIVEIAPDSAMHIVLEVANASGDGFIFDAIYEGAFDWNEWLAEPGMHNYKKDCADIFPGIEIWTEWIYYVMADGTMSGTGAYAGSEFALQHQPLNAYYGLQIGEGANNKNENYGGSAWFFYSGELVVDGVSQGILSSSGDIFFDMDCCLGWQIDYSYTITDDCGNTTEFDYTDLGTGEFNNLDNVTVSGGHSHSPIDITAGVSNLKDPIRITGLQPNPTNDYSTLGFIVTNNMRLRIDLYTMSGQFVQELFDGNASEEVQYVLDIDANSLTSGMYQVRLSSSDYVVVKKLLVSE